jgi:hypothetical protein
VTILAFLELTMLAKYRFAGERAIIRWYEIRNTNLNDAKAVAIIVHGRGLWPGRVM